MTNTDSRIAVGLEELVPWDDADTLENDEAQITEADIRELAAYGFDSDQQTLVGLGPVERRRLARKAAEMADSQRMPQSEPPGPFIAADDDNDEELLRALRGRRLGPWVVAAPLALAIAAAAVVVVRGFASHAPSANQPAIAAMAAPAPALPAQKLDEVGAELAPIETIGASEGGEIEPPPARAEVAPRNAPLTAPVAAAPPVKLLELPPPVVDVSAGAEARVGTLEVTSSPPANVLLDGRPLGKAPRVVQVPPGLHTVLFIHPLYGRQSLTVNVSAGHTSSASANF